MKPSEYALNDPIAAVATALVPAALGIVRTSGTGCIELVASSFSRPEALTGAKGNTLVHGWITSGARRVDEVVAAVYRAPASFTGEDSVEIIGHGGPAVVLAVYRTLVAAGFRPAERGEFTFRAFVNGKTDLARAEAVREIIGAGTDAARGRAVGRLSGALSAEIGEIRDLVLAAIAAIDVEIEYPEDEETVKGAFDTAVAELARDRLARLESSWAAEKRYQDGARVVLAGRTNAGKSSLFNALLKEDRAIVSDVHGTTRDWLEAWADFAGIPVRIFDTAGLRDTGDEIEAEGVERSRSLAAGADIVLYVVDGTEGIRDDDRRFFKEAAGGGPPSIPLILVWNKADKAEALDPDDTESRQALSDLPVAVVCKTSAKSGAGIAGLVGETARLLLGPQTLTDSGRTGLGSERQKEAVRTALGSLDHALEAARGGFPLDAVVQDLEDALSSLGEITGETSSADILDTVFSGFCVGK